MTEKNIFPDKLFLPLNISDFNLFFKGKLQPPSPLEKSHPLFPSNPPLKVEVLSSPPLFLKIWFEVQPLPSQQKGRGGLCGGVHAMLPKDIDLNRMIWHYIHREKVDFLQLMLPEVCGNFNFFGVAIQFSFFSLWKPHFIEKPGSGSLKLLV